MIKQLKYTISEVSKILVPFDQTYAMQTIYAVDFALKTHTILFYWQSNDAVQGFISFTLRRHRPKHCEKSIELQIYKIWIFRIDWSPPFCLYGRYYKWFTDKSYFERFTGTVSSILLKTVWVVYWPNTLWQSVWVFGPDVPCWIWDQGHHVEHRFCFLPRITTVDREQWSTSHFHLRQTRRFQFPHHKLSDPEY